MIKLRNRIDFFKAKWKFINKDKFVYNSESYINDSIASVLTCFIVNDYEYGDNIFLIRFKRKFRDYRSWVDFMNGALDLMNDKILPKIEGEKKALKIAFWGVLDEGEKTYNTVLSKVDKEKPSR